MVFVHIWFFLSHWPPWQTGRSMFQSWWSSDQLQGSPRPICREQLGQRNSRAPLPVTDTQTQMTVDKKQKTCSAKPAQAHFAATKTREGVKNKCMLMSLSPFPAGLESRWSQKYYIKHNPVIMCCKFDLFVCFEVLLNKLHGGYKHPEFCSQAGASNTPLFLR